MKEEGEEGRESKEFKEREKKLVFFHFRLRFRLFLFLRIFVFSFFEDSVFLSLNLLRSARGQRLIAREIYAREGTAV